MLWSKFPEFRFYNEPSSLFRALYGGRGSLFENGVENEPGGFPPINVWASEEKVTVEAELPGFRAEEIDISVLGRTLTIKGERKPEANSEVQYLKRERGSGRFLRTIELPYSIDAEKVEAKYVDGVLEVTLFRTEEDKPKKISIM